MSEFVVRRAGRYSYRRRYPKDIATIIGKVEFTKALGTSDPKEAARLAHIVTVEFDRVCANAQASSVQPATEPAPTAPAHELSNAELTTNLLDSLPGIMRSITQSVLANQMKNPDGAKVDIEWRRRAAMDHLEGRVPYGYNIPPMHVHAMLKALDLIEAGTPFDFQYPASDTNAPVSDGKTNTPADEPSLTDTVLETALQDYSHGVSHRRFELAKRCIKKCIRIPCGKAEAKVSIASWCVSELRKKTESSVSTEVSAIISLLKFVPGWDDFALPKLKALRPLIGAGKARKDARSPVPVPLLQKVIKELPQHLPNKGEHWHAALILCSIYGFRPGELLQSGEEALMNRADIMGDTELIFRIGIAGAKNEASKRDVPVPDHLEQLFRIALRKGASKSETTRTRVERLNRMFGKGIGERGGKITLYSVRHTFADVARSCGYNESEFGPLMGHQHNLGITGIYGGKQPLDKQREILSKVQGAIFPEGLAHYMPQLGLTV
jgi:integrase